jgi:hypothetical protein
MCRPRPRPQAQAARAQQHPREAANRNCRSSSPCGAALPCFTQRFTQLQLAPPPQDRAGSRPSGVGQYASQDSAPVFKLARSASGRLHSRDGGASDVPLIRASYRPQVFWLPNSCLSRASLEDTLFTSYVLGSACNGPQSVLEALGMDSLVEAHWWSATLARTLPCKAYIRGKRLSTRSY